MLAPDDRVLAGVSGGADSVALLLVLKELGYGVAVAHLNHGLRGEESDGDEVYVADLARELDVPCYRRRGSIRAKPGNLEAAGREARKAFFAELARDHGFTRIALAHNRNDRIETFLLHLMRGAGIEGLVSMAPVAGNIVRPLIQTSRKEIEAFLTARGRSWRTDRTNTDISFARNRMRLQTLPSLASLYNARLEESLSRTIHVLADEDAWMRQSADAWLSEHGKDGIDAQALRSEPTALVRRVLRTAIRRAGSSLEDITFDRIEAIRGLLESGKSGKVIQLPGGIRARREFDRLVLTRETEEPTEFSYDLPIPGCVRIPELGQAFRAEVVTGEAAFASIESNPARVLVDGDRLGSHVKIRNWKPGDYYRPAGWPAGKVKKLFQRARVPRSQRRRRPVFVTDSAIVWVASFPVSREFFPDGRSQKIVAFETLQD